MVKIIQSVVLAKVSEAAHDLEESLRQTCELRKEKKSMKTFFDYECEDLRLIVQRYKKMIREKNTKQPKKKNNL
ncbi:hypothetical protein QYM36_012626 [Artemia franciscana]|uniref:Uncharacterized protein n=1 Tax=Artemia franciscana TaxID=6661 RepID=A0AA88HME3_ARTSF|nr:hypothetical protein QYM36_012626 [Artemia franciscana]